MPKNPFYLKAIPSNANDLFCNRVKEIDTLVRRAESKNDVVIYAPRRYGKTSLVRRVQRALSEQGAVTIFTDFSGVGSVNEVATRLATAVYKETHGKAPLWKQAIRFMSTFRPVLRPSLDGAGIEITAEAAVGRSGLELLDSVMEELGKFVGNSGKLFNVVFDEFQEIVVLGDALKIEAIIPSRPANSRGGEPAPGENGFLILSMTAPFI